MRIFNMLSPQQILKDYKEDKYLEENTELLFPVYVDLYNNLVNKSVQIAPKLTHAVKVLDIFFELINKIAQKSKFNVKDNSKEEVKSVGKLIELIPNKKIEEAALALNIIVKFIKNERTNVNNLAFLIWSLFSETRKDDVVKHYLDQPDQIKQALLNPVFLLLLLKYPGFGHLIIQEILAPVELKSPTRMKGSFGDKAFAIICQAIKKTIPEFENKPKALVEELAGSNYWYITESTAAKLSFPKAEKNSKEVDMVCKVGKSLFVCSHKEQKQGGGGQDNQAEDAGSVFKYNEEILREIKSKFNVKNVCFCVFLEGSGEVIKSNHWTGVTAKVEAKDNKDKYLLNSFQFTQLLKSI